MDNPYIVIVHGSWHTPNHYRLLIEALGRKGFSENRTFCPQLASSTKTLPLPETANLEYDTKTIYRVVKPLVDLGHHVVVIMHSYGGVVGGNALTPELLWPERHRDGKKGGVVHLIYTPGFVIPKNTSMSTPLNGELAPWLREDESNGTIDMLEPRKSHYSDIDDEDAAQKWLDLCVLCPTSVVKDETSNDPYEFVGNGIDATYLVCKGDYRLTTEAQEDMAKLLGSTRGMEYCDAGHCPMVSAPDRVAEVLKEAWKRSKRRLEGELYRNGTVNGTANGIVNGHA